MARWLNILSCALALVAFVACGEARQGPLPRVVDLRADGELLRGLVPLRYRIADSGGYPLSVELRVSLDGGPFAPAAAAPGSVAGSSVLVDDEAELNFVWDSLADTGYARRSAQVEIRVSNPFGRARMQSAEFVVANDNRAPQAAFGPRRLEADGSVVLTVGVADADDEPVALQVLVSVDHGDFATATLDGDLGPLAATSTGNTYEFTWDAAADVPPEGSRQVRLAVLAADALGPGVQRESDAFAIWPAVPISVSIAPFTRTQRGEVPIVYTISGPADLVADVSLSYWIADAEKTWPITPTLSYVDSLSNRRAAPQGADYRITWDSTADLADPIARHVRLLLSLRDASGNELDPSVSVLSASLDIDNAALSAGPLFSEIYPGLTGADGFIEFAGLPGTGFGNIRLYRIFKDGSTGEAVGRAFVPLDGAVIGENGVLLIAGPEGPPADLVLDEFETFFPDREPFTLVIDLAESDYYYDAVGIGDFEHAVNSAGSKGRGTPAAYPPAGKSIQRRLANTDASDNALDFVIDTPGPGTAELWPIWP
jgi:hypothetical protein